MRFVRCLSTVLGKRLTKFLLSTSIMNIGKLALCAGATGKNLATKSIFLYIRVHRETFCIRQQLFMPNLYLAKSCRRDISYKLDLYTKKKKQSCLNYINVIDCCCSFVRKFEELDQFRQ